MEEGGGGGTSCRSLRPQSCRSPTAVGGSGSCSEDARVVVERTGRIRSQEKWRVSGLQYEINSGLRKRLLAPAGE